MDWSFRIAQPKDASDIQQLYLELVQDSQVCVSQEAIDRIAADEFSILVICEKSERVVATAFMTICRDVMYGDQPFAVVENVVVRQSERGVGIGSSLMSWIQGKAKSLHCTKIMLLSSSKRFDAHRFFERCGYSGGTKLGFVNYINRCK
jgi:N-acetylglutamate synthase-like GNAT family acetyltransferase